MSLFDIKADFLPDASTFIGSASRRGWARRDGTPAPVYDVGIVYGVEKPNGRWQLYVLGFGSIEKLASVKTMNVDFSNAVAKY